MFKRLNYIFWGLIFMTVHINMGSLQILPNFIGWGMIAYGIYGVYDIYNNKKLLISGKLAAYTAIFSALYLFATYASLGTNVASPFMVVITVSFSILELFVVFYFFDGYIDYLLLDNKPDLAAYFTKQLRYFSITFIIDVILESLVLTFQNDDFSMYVIGLGIILSIWLLILISHLKKLHEDELEDG